MRLPVRLLPDGMILCLTLLLIGCAAPPTLTPPPYPIFAVEPAHGVPGDQVQVNGFGFTPHADALIALGTAGPPAHLQVIGTATTDVIGNFSAVVAIPMIWEDGSRITQQNLYFLVGSPEFGSSVAFTNLAGTPPPPPE